MWRVLDSDAPNLKSVLDPDIVEQNLSRGVEYNKIGAEITETVQSLDLGPFFKIMKCASRKTTARGMDTPLKRAFSQQVCDLKASGRVLLVPKKQAALIDCATTAPAVHTRTLRTTPRERRGHFKTWNNWCPSALSDKKRSK